MVNLIADLLNLSRLNTGKFVIDSTPTDLRMIVDQEVAQLRETAKAKQIDLQWDMPPTFSLVPLDENKLHQVVMNMIDNALYYTPEKGVVEVVLRETPRAVEFRVKDSGIGVPRELQRHLFTKFYRADNARRMRPDGTGLGLYMAKKVVVAQGGSIIFESHEGKGSTFGFRFRKEPTPIASVEVA
jgi:signal transduction histidine kinase